jgi:hypothetical protein
MYNVKKFMVPVVFVARMKFSLTAVLILAQIHCSLCTRHTVTLNYEKCVPEFHVRLHVFRSAFNLFVLFEQQETIWWYSVAILIATTRKRSVTTTKYTCTTWVATRGLAMKFLATLKKVLFILNTSPHNPVIHSSCSVVVLKVMK